MSAESQKSTKVISETLSEKEYNRQRYSPNPSDVHYIPLADLRLFLDQYTCTPYDRLLDYGCGGSPYRALFKTDNYLRADYIDCGGIDYIISDDGRLPVPDDFCNLVLSTQVLEHVLSPQRYLAEAWRVLRPGGKLILTTHGVWEDHGCPYDFWRWTADGLAREVEQAGFRIIKTCKITTGPRAVLFHFAQILNRLHYSWGRNLGWTLWLWLLRRSAFKLHIKRHQWMDLLFSQNRIVPRDAEGHAFYLCIGVEAIKGGETHIK